MGRIRTPAIGGLVEDNPLASGATTLTSAGLAALPTFAAGDWGIITFDPNGRTGEPFSKKVTAHTAGATTATIEAAAIQGTARSIDRDTPWRLTDILDQDGNGSGLIGLTAYNPAANTTVTSTSSTVSDVDATNALVSFVAPPSGIVLVRLTALQTSISSSGYYWGLRSGTDTPVFMAGLGATTSIAKMAVPGRVSGLTPGTTYNWKWCHRTYNNSATATIYYGQDSANSGSALWNPYGPLMMEVWAVNV